MLLQKIVFSLVIAVTLTIFSSGVSFDFENYVSYALNAEKAFERFKIEPIFPLFIFCSSMLGLAPEKAIQSFFFISAFMLVYAVATLACEDRRWNLARAGLAVAFLMPFMLFTLIVPRQAFATGPVLIALLLLRRKGRLTSWRTLILLLISFMAHAPTATLGATLIFVGHGKKLHILILTLCSILFFLYFAAFYSDFFNYESMMYSNYLGNLRDTGSARMAFFTLVALSYFVLSSRKNRGFLGVTKARAFLMASLLTGLFIATYTFLASDVVRLTYLIGIVMIIEILHRFVLVRQNSSKISRGSTLGRSTM